MATTEQNEEYIAGRNAVGEALRSGRPIDHLIVAKGERGGSISVLIARCRERGVPVKEVDRRRLDSLCGSNHQGIAAVAACKAYATLDDLFDLADARREPPLFVVCDELEDPHNLGAIIRTAEAAGADGVIIPKRRSATVNPTVFKTSAGAAAWIKIARVSNLVDTIKTLKKHGVWVYGAEADGTPIDKADLSGALALVIGSEGFGLGKLVRENCDVVLSLPMFGKVNSLNASVCAGILMYEAVKYR